MSSHHSTVLRHLLLGMLATAAFAVTGCNGLHPSSTNTEQFFATPGRFAAARTDAARPRVGIVLPAVQVVAGADPAAHVSDDADLALVWLVQQTDRVNPVSHERLSEMLASQGIGDVLAPGQLIHPAPMQGVDYLLLCDIRDLSIAGNEPPDKLSVAGVEDLLHVSKTKPRIQTHCVIQLSLVDPRTALVAAAISDSFQRSCSPESMGLSFSPPESAFGQLRLNDEQITQVMRIVLDDAMRQLLPRLDALGTPTGSAIAATPTPATNPAGPATTSSRNTSPSAAAKLRCPECGFDCSSFDEFCPNCGAKLPHARPSGPATKP